MEKSEPAAGAWPFSLAVMAVGVVAVALASREPWPAGSLPALAACLLVALYGEWRAVSIRGFGVLSLAEPLYFAATLAYGALPGALTAALGGAAAGVIHGKRPVVQVFNLGWAGATFGAVALVHHLLGRPDPFTPRGALAAALCALVYGLIAGGLQAAGQRFFEGVRLGEALPEMLSGARYAVVSAFGLGLLGVEMLRLGAAWVLLLALPIEVFSGYVVRSRLNRRLQQALEDLERAQAALVASERRAAAGLLAAGVAHEINNPLAAILAACHTLSRRPEKAAESGQLIEKAALRCRDIVERLLTFARPPRDRGPSDLAEVLEETLALVGRDLEEAGVRVEGPGPGFRVAVAAGPLMQVLANLLQNARQAMEGGGAVRLEARREEGRVVVRVRDTGRGIEAALRGRIWEPFFTTREPGKGTGLGLAVVRSLVEEVGGTIELESSTPGDTVFRLELPA